MPDQKQVERFQALQDKKRSLEDDKLKGTERISALNEQLTTLNTELKEAGFDENADLDKTLADLEAQLDTKLSEAEKVLETANVTD